MFYFSKSKYQDIRTKNKVKCHISHEQIKVEINRIKHKSNRQNNFYSIFCSHILKEKRTMSELPFFINSWGLELCNIPKN